MTVLIILLTIVLVCILVVSYFLSTFSMTIRRQTLEEAYAWQSEHYDVSWYPALEKTEGTLISYDGYELHTVLLKSPCRSNRYVIISHGYTDNRYGSLKYAKNYLDLGFNVLLYDLRGHGENQKTFCTYSIRESKDLAALIQELRNRVGPDITLGIHGESLGAASSVACLKYSPAIQFVVSDCAFSNILSVMKHGLQKMHLPGFLVYSASLWTKIRYGYYYHEMKPIESLKGSTIPILFLHGENDDFIFPEHSMQLQHAAEGYSEVHLIPNAGHAASVLTAPDEYRRILLHFLSSVLDMPS